MASVIEVRDPRASFDLTIPDTVLEVGVDGVSNAMIGFPVSKLTFHVLVPPKPGSNVEQRKAVLNLSIGTVALIQLCQQMVKGFGTSQQEILNAAEQFQAQLREMLNAVAPGDGNS